MRDAHPFIKPDLINALENKRIQVLDTRPERLADLITTHGLTEVIAGRHDGKPVTFAKGFELVFGERLTLKGAA